MQGRLLPCHAYLGEESRSSEERRSTVDDGAILVALPKFACWCSFHPPDAANLERRTTTQCPGPAPSLPPGVSQPRSPGAPRPQTTTPHVVDLTSCSYLSSQLPSFSLSLSLSLSVRQVSVPHMASSHRQTRLSPCFTWNPCPDPTRAGPVLSAVEPRSSSSAPLSVRRAGDIVVVAASHTRLSYNLSGGPGNRSERPGS